MLFIVSTRDLSIKTCNICLIAPPIWTVVDNVLAFAWWRSLNWFQIKFYVGKISILMMSLFEAVNKTGPGGNKKKWKLNCTKVPSEWQKGVLINQHLWNGSFIKHLPSCFSFGDSGQCHRNTWRDRCWDIFFSFI